MEHLWYQLSKEEVFSLLKTGEGGVSPAEAQKRLKKFGPNLIHKKALSSPIKIF